MHNNLRAFTLIETLVYLALFSILMAGATVTAYGLFESSSRAHSISVVQEEGGYLLGKIGWALYGAQAITVPAPGVTCTSNCILTIVKWDTSVGNPLTLALSGTNLTLQRGSAVAQVLNNDDVWFSALSFAHATSSGDGINPESLKTTFTLSMRTPNGAVVSRDFSSITYLRQ